jgi:hypothetical protein
VLLQVCPPDPFHSLKGHGIDIVEDDPATSQRFALEDAAQGSESEGGAARANQDNLGSHGVVAIPGEG